MKIPQTVRASPLSWGRGPGCTAIELRRNGFFPILIVILLLISKNLSRARLRLGLRLRACQCGPAAGLNSMAVHPGPLPQGEGESSADFHHNLARCLPDEPPEQPKLSPAVPSPRGRVRLRGIGLPFDPATRTLPEIVELRESSGRAGGFP